MKDLVLFPNEEMARVHADDPRFADAMIFLVQDGPLPLEGLRFRQAWICMYCFTEPAYGICMEVIFHSIAFSSNPHTPFLF